MSDNEAGNEGRSGAWTEAAKLQFLLRIVGQFREDGRSIKWDRLNMPGRTTKSLQNMWTKINKEISALEAEGGVTTPKKATPRKPRAKKVTAPAADGDDDDDDDDDDSYVTPKKRSGEDAETIFCSGKKKMKTEDFKDEDML